MSVRLGRRVVPVAGADGGQGRRRSGPTRADPPLGGLVLPYHAVPAPAVLTAQYVITPLRQVPTIRTQTAACRGGT